MVTSTNHFLAKIIRIALFIYIIHSLDEWDLSINRYKELVYEAVAYDFPNQIINLSMEKKE